MRLCRMHSNRFATINARVFYSGSRLDAVHSDLSPNLSPTRREALIPTPLPAKNIIPFPSPCRRGLSAEFDSESIDYGVSFS